MVLILVFILGLVYLTLKLNQVRWDQAIDIVVRVNGLDWAREGKTVRVFPAGKSRR